MGDERTPDGDDRSGWGTPPPPRTPPPPQEGWDQPPGQQPPPQEGWDQPPGQQPPPQQGWGQPPPPQQGWGQPPHGAWPPPHGQPGTSTNGVAIAALVCGLVALPLAIVLVGGFVGVVAVVLGIIGLTRVRTTGSGRGMALTGIIAGALAAVFTIGLVAVGVRIFQDPEFQEQFQEEMRRQEELLEQQEQQQD